MPQLYDAKTGQPVTPPSPEEAHAGILSGQYGVDADAGPVTVKGPDGQIYTGPASGLADAIKSGYRLLTPDEELKDQVAQQESAKGLTGSLEAAGSSALNQLAFGIPGALQEATETPVEKARREAVEEYHSTARGIGGVAGGVGSLLVGGQIFKGAELAGQAIEHGIVPAAAVADASLGARVAAKAANYATQGALLSSPQAFIQGIIGDDPKKAAETLLWGTGAGLGLGAVSELAGSAASAVGDAVVSKLQDPKTAEWLDDWANKRFVKIVGASRADTDKMGRDGVRQYADYLYENGLIKPGQSRQEIGDGIEAAQKKWGKDIGDTIDSLDSILHRGEGAAIGPKPPPEIVEAALKPGQLGDAIRTAFESPELHMDMNRDQAAAVESVAKSADQIPAITVNGQRVVSFEAAQKFTSDLRQKYVASIKRAMSEGGIKGPEAVTALDRVKSAAYESVRNTLHQAADNVAQASNSPQLIGRMAVAKANYQKLATLETFARKLQSIQAGNRMIGLTDFQHMGRGPASAATSMLGAAMGSAFGPGGAVVGMQAGRFAGVPLDLMIKKWGEDKGLVIISALAKKAAKEGPDALSAVLVSEGRKRLTATMHGVGDTIRQMAIRGTVATPMAGSDHMTHLLGSTQGLSPEAQDDRLASRLASLAANPQAMVAATSAASAPIAAGSPQLGAAYQEQLRTALQYLHDAVPKPAAPPPPFAPDDWTPTAADKLAFHDKAEIVNNPMRALVHMQRGTLSDAHLDALQAVYPRVLGQIRSEILATAAKNPDLKLPAPERRSAAKLLGMPLDTMSQHLAALQSVYAAPAPQPQPKTPRAPRGAAKIKNMPSAASAFTGSQGPSPTGA